MVTLLVAQSPSLLNDAVEEYGAFSVYTTHIIMHYLPVILNLTYLRSHLWVDVVRAFHPCPMWQPLVAALVSAVFGLLYTTTMDPQTTYKSTMTLPTLVSVVGLTIAASMILLAVFFAASHRGHTGPRPHNDGPSTLVQP